MNNNLEDRLKQLEEKGVELIDPRQVYVAPEIDLDRIYAGAVLYPGTRLTGAKTLVGSGAEIGTEGPVTLKDAVIGSNAEVASGFITGAVLLPRAKAGANCHYRKGTLLEEEASTAHCVGLKQTILMYGATLGSLINFCDILISGGHSRKEHTEVGSGFIHFNFTPYGVNGDKATASLVGNVTEGVFLDQPKIFLGGMSGMVGPTEIGFGAMTIAGQVVRHDVKDNTMHADAVHRMDREWSPTAAKLSAGSQNKKRKKNIEYLTQLYALKKWYTQVRIPRAQAQGDEELVLVYEAAIDVINSGIKERTSKFGKFAKEWSLEGLHEEAMTMEFAPLPETPDWKTELPYDEWIWQLSEKEKGMLHTALVEDANKVREALA